MSVNFIDVGTQYARDKKLKKTDVNSLLKWLEKQPHLPQINEFQLILFLQSCYYSIEAAKSAIDAFFTIKTLDRDLFGGRNPTDVHMQEAFKTGLVTPLPKKTPEGYTVFFVKLMDTMPENYNFINQLKYLDMVFMSHLYQEGISEGHVVVFDMKGTVFGHMSKVGMAGPSVIKKFSFYLQEAVPLRLKGLHYFNIVPFMDKILSMVRPFMNLGILDILHLHNTLEDLAKFVPLECLPQDYGGSAESTSTLHEKNKMRLEANASLFEWENQQTVDESKRPEKTNKVNEMFGIEGTFKQLEID